MKILGWKPPQRPQWVKEIMQTPGHTRVQLLLLLILASSSVSSTVFLLSRKDKEPLPVVDSIEFGNKVVRIRATGSLASEVFDDFDSIIQTVSKNTE